MVKSVASSKFSEWKGLDRISAAVHEMHCIYREISKDDFGIDGEIEVVIPKEDGVSYETTGGIIKLQSKAGSSYIKHDTDTGFYVYVKQQDLQLWNGANYPVIFVVYHPEEDQLYWKDVKKYIKANLHVFQPPLRIEFDKTRDVFDETCYKVMCSLAKTSPPPVSLQQQEHLYSNLLLVKRAPGSITQASTTFQQRQQVRMQLQGAAPPFTVKAGKLYTLADLRDPECVLRPFCDVTTIRDISVQQWIRDESCRSDYTFLLSQLLTSHLYRCGVRYNREYHRYYFPREDDSRLVFKRAWLNVRTSLPANVRIVTKYYHYGQEYYWRHLAAQLTFQYIGDVLCLQVLPKYLFTFDGQALCDPDKVGAYTTKIKAVERNIHVLNHVLFWSDVLSQRTPSIDIQLADKILLVVEKAPLSGIAPFAIVNDPAVYDDFEQDLQPPLFNSTGKEDDDNFYI